MNKNVVIPMILISVVISFFIYDMAMDRYVKYSNSLPVYECNYTRGKARVSDVYRPDDFNECEMIKIIKPIYDHCSASYNNLKQMYKEGKCYRIYSKKLEYGSGWCQISYTIKNGKKVERDGGSSNLDDRERRICKAKLKKEISQQ